MFHSTPKVAGGRRVYVSVWAPIFLKLYKAVASRGIWLRTPAPWRLSRCSTAGSACYTLRSSGTYSDPPLVAGLGLSSLLRGFRLMDTLITSIMCLLYEHCHDSPFCSLNPFFFSEDVSEIQNLLLLWQPCVCVCIYSRSLMRGRWILQRIVADAVPSIPLYLLFFYFFFFFFSGDTVLWDI